MWMVAALAFVALAVISLCALMALVAIFPEATQDIGFGATLLYGAAGISVIIAIPLAVLAARRMTTSRDRRVLRD